MTDKGTIFTTNDNFKTNCYVDANLTGLYGQESENNPLSARSRTGYILFFCGCPLLWKLQLRSEMALSTFHAEYVALYVAMRQLIVVQGVLQILLPKSPPSTPKSLKIAIQPSFLLTTKSFQTARNG